MKRKTVTIILVIILILVLGVMFYVLFSDNKDNTGKKDVVPNIVLNSESIDGKLNKEITIGLYKNVVFESQGIMLKVLKINDSRCPDDDNTSCTWSGELNISLEVTYNGESTVIEMGTVTAMYQDIEGSEYGVYLVGATTEEVSIILLQKDKYELEDKALYAFLGEDSIAWMNNTRKHTYNLTVQINDCESSKEPQIITDKAVIDKTIKTLSKIRVVKKLNENISTEKTLNFVFKDEENNVQTFSLQNNMFQANDGQYLICGMNTLKTIIEIELD